MCGLVFRLTRGTERKLLRRLLGAMHALRERGGKIRNRGDRGRSGAAVGIERGAQRSISAEPTTAPSAACAMPRAASGVRMPKPTQTGNLVWRLMRATAAETCAASALALPVMPVIET